MKTFKIKDLMVSIATEKEVIGANFCPPQSIACTVHTPIHHCCKLYSAVASCYGACSNLLSFKKEFECPGYTVNCPGLSAIPCTGFSCAGGSRITDFITRTDVENELVLFQEAELSELKTQLAQLQKQVEVKLKRSPEELDQLETKLNEALNEVRAEKANISKKK
ncbi:MAG: hypothetical protein ABIN67_08265 [Ferruginibacter sp.]